MNERTFLDENPSVNAGVFVNSIPDRFSRDEEWQAVQLPDEIATSRACSREGIRHVRTGTVIMWIDGASGVLFTPEGDGYDMELTDPDYGDIVQALREVSSAPSASQIGVKKRGGRRQNRGGRKPRLDLGRDFADVPPVGTEIARPIASTASMLRQNKSTSNMIPMELWMEGAERLHQHYSANPVHLMFSDASNTKSRDLVRVDRNPDGSVRRRMPYILLLKGGKKMPSKTKKLMLKPILTVPPSDEEFLEPAKALHMILKLALGRTDFRSINATDNWCNVKGYDKFVTVNKDPRTREVRTLKSLVPKVLRSPTFCTVEEYKDLLMNVLNRQDEINPDGTLKPLDLKLFSAKDTVVSDYVDVAESLRHQSAKYVEQVVAEDYGRMLRSDLEGAMSPIDPFSPIARALSPALIGCPMPDSSSNEDPVEPPPDSVKEMLGRFVSTVLPNAEKSGKLDLLVERLQQELFSLSALPSVTLSSEIVPSL
jgi:hypothetical protein